MATWHKKLVRNRIQFENANTFERRACRLQVATPLTTKAANIEKPSCFSFCSFCGSWDNFPFALQNYEEHSPTCCWKLS